MGEVRKKIVRCMTGAVIPSLSTTLWLLKIMLPISFTVCLMQYYGVIAWLAQFLNPVFCHMGLPGTSAIAFITSAASTTYAGLAVMLTMEMTMREATILAIMATLCHALPMECAVIKRVGSDPIRMGLLRIAAAFLAAFYLNMVLPAMPQPFMGHPVMETAMLLHDVVVMWLYGSVKLSLMICALIYALMVLQRLFDQFGIMYLLVRPLRPVMRLFGLPENAAYLWLVGNVLGISYGSAAMLDLESSGRITKEDADEVNYHLIMNHSMLEDTMVFASCGVSALWILSTRMLFAYLLVWGRKGVIFLKHRFFHSRQDTCAN